MEKEIFRNVDPTMNFVDQENTNLHHLPKEILKSGTIETLINQNEELMARLNITLRRLAAIENENLSLSHENKETRNQFAGLRDQVLVYREKDDVWRRRTAEAEQKLESLITQIHIKDREFVELRQNLLEERDLLRTAIDGLRKEIATYRRYHGRINTFVRPFVSNLKQEQSRLKSNQTILANRAESLSLQIEGLRLQNKNLIENSKRQINELNSEKNALVEAFETQRGDFTREISSLRHLETEIVRRNTLLDKAQERVTYFENRIVVLERNRDEAQLRFNQEIERVQQQMIDWRSQAQAFEVQIANLTAKYNEANQRSDNYKLLSEQLEQQLSALRLLWADKSGELERLTQSNAALEKINAELCCKLNEVRNDQVR